MPRQPKVGTCTVCHLEKPLFDVKNQVCGSCMGKKGGGRPKAIVRKPPESPPAQGLKTSGKTPPKPPETENDQASDDNVKYLCDACNKPVRYGQHKCSCGTWIDWRGSPVQDDPDLVVCPECGAICGHVDQELVKCPRCNFGG